MSPGRGSWRGAALLLSLLAPTWPSRAQPLPAYDLDYTADPSCPDRVMFVAWVEAQLREARETAPGARARALVQLQQAASGSSARLELTREDGSRYARELGGESCEAAAQGLAFVLAYALGGGDPGEATRPEIQPPAAPPAPAPATAPPIARASAPVPTTATSAPSPTSASGWRIGVAAQLGIRGGLGPTWTTAFGGVLDLRRRQKGVAPVLRVALLRSEPIQRLDAFGSTEFAWLAGRLEGCPLQMPLVRALQLVPCAGVHVGRLRAEGSPSSAEGSGRRANQPWVDAFGTLRLEWTLWRLLQLELQGELLVPLTRYRFAFDNPDTAVYQAPRLAGAGFVGLGLHFP